MDIFWNIVVVGWPFTGILLFIFATAIALSSVFAFREGRRRLPTALSASGLLGLVFLGFAIWADSSSVSIAAAALLSIGGYGGLGGLLIGTAYREGGIPGWYRWPLSAGCLLIAGVLLCAVVRLG